PPTCHLSEFLDHLNPALRDPMIGSIAVHLLHNLRFLSTGNSYLASGARQDDFSPDTFFAPPYLLLNRSLCLFT
ncbi:hypothetical protein, partial [Bathymodiolus thermophilus thioautotrophic gill symbiont]|uniref:hypothetical protein n=1 Tax=Bathymodiolus thermophilus thioautotrophic gill symbiont TaxID=2360 RepID=UPI001ED8E7B9